MVLPTAPVLLTALARRLVLGNLSLRLSSSSQTHIFTALTAGLGRLRWYCQPCEKQVRLTSLTVRGRCD